jgi:large subunit ribosomal protein L15
MSLLEGLKPKSGSSHARKRVGRGRGSGLGQTSGKGHKGQLARTGGKVRRGFEGGQTPLVRRLPKFGFKCPSSVNYQIINLSDLEGLSGEITLDVLKKSGLAQGNQVKVLANGKISHAVTLKGLVVSAGAKVAIEAVGGKIEG